MNYAAFFHMPHSEYCYGLDDKHITLRFRCASGDVQSARVRFGDRFLPKNELSAARDMTHVARDRNYDYFEVTLSGAPERLCYYFEVTDINGLPWFFSDAGIAPESPSDTYDYFELNFSHRAEWPDVPAWFREAFIYQIFPDSFANGVGRLDVSPRELKREDGGTSIAVRGGTIEGITLNLPYIKDLGADCLYLNPIFTADTVHRYDTADYFSIDPLLGTGEDLKRLVEQAHAMGIRVLLDGVFNHCGPYFFAWRDVMKNCEKSKYVKWFYRIDSFPPDTGDRVRAPSYAAFAYTGRMPKLNTADPDMKRYLIDVALYWIREYDIDGWRLDVADEPDGAFWRDMRREVRALKPDAILLGESWGPSRRWLDGDMFDSAMNYSFMRSCEAFFACGIIDAVTFGQQIAGQLMRYKRPMQYAQMNLLDSHDVARFLGRCDGRMERYRAALVYQFMHVGVPSVYYGDEKGMKDVLERNWRNNMIWGEPSNSPYEWIKKLAAIRREHACVIDGRYEQCYAGKRVYAFLRASEDEALLVVQNAGDSQETVTLPVTGRVSAELLHGKEIEIKEDKLFVTLEPWESHIYHLAVNQ